MDCLVTTLKGVVDNGNLKKYGSVTLVVDKWKFPTIVPCITLRATEACKVILPEGEYFTTSDGVTPSGGEQSRVYNLTASVSDNTILYMSYANGSPYRITITNAKALAILKPSEGNRNVYVDSDTINYNYCTNLIGFGNPNCMMIAATDNTNITDLFSSTTLTGIIISGNNTLTPRVTGNVEDCVVKLWNKNKRSGIITVTFGINNALSFHNTPLVTLYDGVNLDLKFVYSSSGVSVTYNDNVIGSYDGTSWTYPN